MMKQNYQPVIKWCGGKRKSAAEIASYFPACFQSYFEPFLGGGAMLRYVNAPNILCSDICKPLIDLWLEIKHNPEQLAQDYEKKWNNLYKIGHTEYYKIRDEFNKTKKPADFLFLTRTCINGLIRFNNLEQFNSSFHLTRKGIKPETLRKITLDWSNAIKNVNFLCVDYELIIRYLDNKSLVYLDPPYFHSTTWYYGKFDHERLFNWLEKLNQKDVKWLMSYDGKSASKEYDVNIPKELYKRKVDIKAGKSGFRGVMKGKSDDVIESLYINY